MNKVIAQTQPQFPSPGAAVQPGGKDPWYIITNLVGKDFKVRYRNMSLGVFWSLVNPLIMMAVLTYIFTYVFSRRDIPNFGLFLLCGLLPYNFFAIAWSAGTMSVVSNAALIKQIPFQRELVPISVVLGNALHYGLQLVLLLTAIVIVVGPNAQWGWLPVVLLLQLTFVCGLSLLSSALNVYFRDLQYVVDSVNTVMFWAVPIFYSFADVDPGLSWLYEINPVAAVILVMRRILLYGVPPGATLLKLAAVSLITLLVGYTVFVRAQKDFSDYL